MTLAQMESRFFELKGKLAVGQISEDEFKREMETLRFQDLQGNWWMIGAQSGRWYYYDGSRWLLGQPNEPSGGAIDRTNPSAQPVTPFSAVPPAKGQDRTSTVQQGAPANGRGSISATGSAAAVTKTPYYVPPSQTASSEVTPAPSAIPRPQPQPAPVAKASTQAQSAQLATHLPPRSADSPIHAPTLADRVRQDVSHVHVPSVHVPPVHMPQVHTPSPIRRYSPYTILAGAIVGGLLIVAVMWLAVDNLVPGKPITSFFGKSLGIGAASISSTPSSRGTPLAAGANVDDLLSVADDLVSKSQFDPGLNQYQTASKLAPNDADVYVRWSRALALAGRIQDAINTAQRATKLDPNSADAYAQLSRALAWSGQADAAVSAGEKAVSLDSKNSNAHAFLAEAYLRGGQEAEAEKQAAAALDGSDSNIDGHRAKGWVALIAGRQDEALSEWHRVVQLAPDTSFYHYEFGQVYAVYLNDPADAIPEYQKAVQLFPPYVPAYIALGSAYLAQNQPGLAILQYQKALTYDPNSNEAYVGLGQGFQKQGRCPQAIPYFQKSLQLNPNTGDALRGLSDCGALAKGQSVPPPAPPTAVGLSPIPTAVVQATVAPLAALTPSSKAGPGSTPGAPKGGATAGRIAFSVYDGQFHLYVENTDGSNRKLLAEMASSPAFSPDGSQLLYTSWDPTARGIHRIEADGTADQQISLRFEDVLPSWSPDGTRFVYSTRAGAGADITRRAYTLRVSDPTAKATQDPDVFVDRAQYGVWGPGDRIAFRDCGLPADICGLAVVSSDGSGKTPLVANMNATAPAWSKDGKLIAYTSDYGGNWDIYIVNANGGSPARLTTDPAEDGLPTFSPDGKQIAYLSNRDGSWAIWAMGIDGSNQHKLFDLGGDPAGSVEGNSPGQPGQVWYEQRISWH